MKTIKAFPASFVSNILRRIAGELPDDQYITTCDVRSRAVNRIASGTGFIIVVIGFLSIMAQVIYYFVVSNALGLRIPVIFLFVIAMIALLAPDSRLNNLIYRLEHRLFAPKISLFGMKIPVMVFVIVGGVTIHVVTYMMNNVLSNTDEALGIILLAYTVSVSVLIPAIYGLSYITRFIYKRTIGRFTTIAFVDSQGEIITLKVTVLKAWAIRASLCKVIDMRLA